MHIVWQLSLACNSFACHSAVIVLSLGACQGRSQEFSIGGGGGVTLCQSDGTHQIVMAFSTPAVSLK